MRKLANKKSGDSVEEAHLPSVKRLISKQEQVYLDDLPDYMKQTILMLVNNTGR